MVGFKAVLETQRNHEPWAVHLTVLGHQVLVLSVQGEDLIKT